MLWEVLHLGAQSRTARVLGQERGRAGHTAVTLMLKRGINEGLQRQVTQHARLGLSLETIWGAEGGVILASWGWRRPCSRQTQQLAIPLPGLRELANAPRSGTLGHDLRIGGAHVGPTYKQMSIVKAALREDGTWAQEGYPSALGAKPVVLNS